MAQEHKYNMVRFGDRKLFYEAKMRAVMDNISLMKLVEKAVKKYLQDSVDRVCDK